METLLRLIDQNDVDSFRQHLQLHATDRRYLNKSIYDIFTGLKYTMLSYAVHEEKIAIVDMLVRNPLVHISFEDFYSIVSYATHVDFYQPFLDRTPPPFMAIVEYIVDHDRFQLNQRNAEGKTILHVLMEDDCDTDFVPHILSQLVRKGADPRLRTGYGIGDAIARSQQFIRNKLPQNRGLRPNQIATMPAREPTWSARLFLTPYDVGLRFIDAFVKDKAPVNREVASMDELLGVWRITSAMIICSRRDAIVLPEDLVRIGITPDGAPVRRQQQERRFQELPFYIQRLCYQIATIALSMRMVDTKAYAAKLKGQIIRKAKDAPKRPRVQQQQQQQPKAKKVRRDVVQYARDELPPDLVEQLAHFFG